MPEHEASTPEKRVQVARQLRVAMRGGAPPCGCGNKPPWWKLYRCYYCGAWYCEACAPGHFGGKRPTFVEGEDAEETA